MCAAARSSSSGWPRLWGLLATARTCSRSLAESSSWSGVSGGSGPAWGRPGTAVIQSGEEPVDNRAGNVVEAPSDPLAELGVAPGQGTENEGTAPAPKR